MFKKLPLAFLCGAVMLAAQSAHAALTANQIAIIVNSRSQASRDIALLYQQARGIPRENIIFIDLQPGELVDEPTYNLRIKAPIRRYLLEHKLDKQIICLVTTYDVPLRVGAQSESPADAGEIISLRRQMVQGMEELQQSVKDFDDILPAGIVPPATEPGRIKPAIPPLNDLAVTLDKSAKGAVDRITHAEGDSKKKGVNAYVKLQERLLGTGGALSSSEIARLSTSDADLLAHLQPMVAQMKRDDLEIQELADQEIDPSVRTRRLSLIRADHGTFGAVRQIEHDLQMLSRDQTDASVDNELMCLWNDHYFKAQWIWSPISLDHYGTSKATGPVAATGPATRPGDGPWRPMMVCRLDGTTPAKVLDMINTTLKVEKAGLDGTLYLDAQGTDDHKSAYGIFDDDIRSAYRFLKAHSTIPVVIEDTHALLAAKDCPNAAVYCGWYSPGNYVESCQWLPGSVCYHVASGEMHSLHNQEDHGWCKNLLDRGVAGTLGPTDEPYLHSFPKPSQFLPLLLSGQWTQGEVFYMTNPLLSWRIAYVGDPLYNPFKKNPRITIEALKQDPKLRKAFEICPPGEPVTQPEAK